MEVVLRSCTILPIHHLSRMAGYSTGKEGKYSISRVKHCMMNHHDSVFEHVMLCFEIKGISRACSHQLVRHRLCSFVQQSQRYTKIDTRDPDSFVYPDSLPIDYCDEVYATAAETYEKALADGVKPEDARYLLPEGTKTNIVMTCNLREFMHIYKMRTSEAAQWEIRELCKCMFDEISENGDEEWDLLLDWIIERFDKE